MGAGLRYLSLAAFLLFFWLVLSGHYTPFLIGAGIVVTLGCLAVAIRIRAADEEGHPIELFTGILTYFPWLAWEIAKSGWSVTKIIVDPSLPISPTMTAVKASQRTTAGMVTYANSITLTPGTITVGMRGNDLTVHALTRAGAIDLEGGGMDARVTRCEEGRL